jgi:hypothetical protein
VLIFLLFVPARTTPNGMADTMGFGCDEKIKIKPRFDRNQRGSGTKTDAPKEGNAVRTEDLSRV